MASEGGSASLTPLSITYLNTGFSTTGTQTTVALGTIPAASLVVVLTCAQAFRAMTAATIGGVDPGFAFSNIGFGNAASNSVAWAYTAGGLGAGNLVITMDNSSIRQVTAFYVSGVDSASIIGAGLTAGNANWTAKSQTAGTSPAFTLTSGAGVNQLAIAVLNAAAANADSATTVGGGYTEIAPPSPINLASAPGQRVVIAAKAVAASTSCNGAATLATSRTYGFSGFTVRGLV